MLTISTQQPHGKTCDGVSRRDFIRAGSLCVGGLTLADLLRAQAQAGESAAAAKHKAVIMVWLEGGPSHVDMYDIKPKAPSEYRSEYRPIETVVPGMEICELLPKQAQIADKFSLIRSMTFQSSEHGAPEELLTGFLGSGRPSFGAVMSYLDASSGRQRLLPPFVQLDAARASPQSMAFPGWLGAAHKPFIPGGKKKEQSLSLLKEISLDRLDNRRALLKSFDRLNKNIDDAHGSLAAMDDYTNQAMEMIRSTKARDAFDVSREPAHTRKLYGPATQLLQARRLVEAGVKVVSCSFIGSEDGRRSACGFGGGTWDTHGNTYKCLGHLLPQLDQAVYALATDLHERGLDQDVAVVIWGEFGRDPRITPNLGRAPGRGHWPNAGFTMLLGGGLKMGQVVGATDAKGGLPATRPYTPQNVLATLYHVLGIHPNTTLPNLQGRPMYLLEDRTPIAELV